MAWFRHPPPRALSPNRAVSYAPMQQLFKESSRLTCTCSKAKVLHKVLSYPVVDQLTHTLADLVRGGVLRVGVACKVLLLDIGHASLHACKHQGRQNTVLTLECPQPQPVSYQGI
jgi:hypothetical protein